MKYICVAWRHDFPDEPVLYYAELDDARWEVRHVEVHRSGASGYASAAGESGGAGLGELPVPALDEIAADPQFEPSEISEREFEDVWRRAQLAPSPR